MSNKKRKKNKKTANKRALVKKEDRAIIEKMTIEEAKDFIDQISNIPDDPKRIMKKLSEDLLPQISSGKANKKVYKETEKVIVKALIAFGLDTHYLLAEITHEKYRPLAIEFSRQLIEEFDCKTPSEKALSQIVVNAYLRVINDSRKYENCLRAGKYLSNERTKYLAVISKQLDRANRQFITALTTLKQIKTSSFQVNVKTKTTFIAENQQLNISPSDKNENIEPK